MLGFLLTKIESEINKAPSKVVRIKLVSILLINRFENFVELIKTIAGEVWYSVPDIADEIFDVELVQLFYWCRKLLARSRLKIENILIKLEPCWDVTRDVSTLFEGQVLGFVYICKRVREDLKLCSKVVLNDIVISC